MVRFWLNGLVPKKFSVDGCVCDTVFNNQLWWWCLRLRMLVRKRNHGRFECRERFFRPLNAWWVVTERGTEAATTPRSTQLGRKRARDLPPPIGVSHLSVPITFCDNFEWLERY